MDQVQGDYQFSAEPLPVDPTGVGSANPSALYRDLYQDMYQQPPANLMWDRRIVRGNTYAAMVIPVSTQQEMERQQEMEHRRQVHAQQSRMRQSEHLQDELDEKLTTEREMTVESHLDLVEDALEDITEVPPNYRTEPFNEFFINRPPTPEFIPIQKGIEISTQIEDDELFDYEVEVEPILQVLIAKSVEQGRMEIIEEDEAQELEEHKTCYEQERDGELLEVQRLEAEFIRRKEEEERRNLQAATRRNQMQLAHQKYCSRILGKRLLSNTKKAVVKQLVDVGTFRHPHRMAWDDQLTPWLFEAVVDDLAFEDSSEAVAAELTEGGVSKLAKLHREALRAELNRKHELEMERVRIQRETDERKKQRAEMRVLRQAWQEKMAFKDQIDFEII